MGKKLYKFDKHFIKSYDENGNKGCFLEVDVKYSKKKLNNLHSDFPFLPERIKIENCNKLACSVGEKKIYAVHIKILK